MVGNDRKNQEKNDRLLIQHKDKKNIGAKINTQLCTSPIG